ncbi:MAG: sensor histidine kinase [Gammaproteobacteria bacterium]|nr:sensor histidine kinase [Gammaproteobacteria bacterium]
MTSQPQITDINEAISSSDTAKWSYTSLIFSLFYFFPIIFTERQFDAEFYAPVLLTYLLFLIFFVLATRAKGNKAIPPILAIIFVSAFGAQFIPTSNTLFGYASFLASYYFRPKISILLFITNLIAQLSAAYAFDLMTPMFLGPAMGVSTGLMFYGFFSRKEWLHQANQKLKSQQIEQLAAIAERERIARDMHDTLGHSLSSLALKAELTEKLINKEKFAQAQSESKEVAALARGLLSEIRQAVTGLNSKNLSQELRKLINELKHIGFEVSSVIELSSLDAKVESTLALICKEWFTNIMRHSNGNKVLVSVQQSEDKVTLNIEDNGTTKNIEAGNGITGMRFRVEEVRGNFAISTENAVKLSVSIPLNHL